MSAPEQDQGGALPPELAELQGLAMGADAALDQAQAPPLPPGQEAPSPAIQGPELGAMLQAVMTMAEPMAPYLPRAYTPEVCDRIGVAIAAVAEKRGWDLSNVMSPEVMLAFVTVPPTLAAVKMAKDYYAWLERKQAQDQAAPAPAPAMADGS